jgi:hypothetical protein
VVVVCGIQNSATDAAPPTVTINGNAAIRDGSARPRSTTISSRSLCGIYRLANPTGTTADIVVTFPVAMYDCTIFVYSVLNVASVKHVDIGSHGSELTSIPVRHYPVDTVDGGTVIFGTMIWDVGSVPTLSGVTIDGNVSLYGTTDYRLAAHQDITTGSQSYDVTVDAPDTFDSSAVVAVSYSPDPVPDLDVGYVGQNQIISGASTYTFTSEPVGDADANRSTVVVVNYVQAGTGSTPPTMTIGGVSATCDGYTFGGIDSGFPGRAFSAVFRLANPTGTTATIVVSLSTAAFSCVIDVYSVINVGSVVDTGSATGTSTSSPHIVALDLDTVTGGALIAGAEAYGFTDSILDGTWVGTTKNSQYEENSDDTELRGSASSEIITGETPRSLDLDLTMSPESYAAIAVSYAPAAGEDDCLANDVISASSVTQPALHQLHALLANDVISASSVGQPAVHQSNVLLASDVLSTSSVGQPQVHQNHVMLANDLVSASHVSNPDVNEEAGAGEVHYRWIGMRQVSIGF